MDWLNCRHTPCSTVGMSEASCEVNDPRAAAAAINQLYQSAIWGPATLGLVGQALAWLGEIGLAIVDAEEAGDLARFDSLSALEASLNTLIDRLERALRSNREGGHS